MNKQHEAVLQGYDWALNDADNKGYIVGDMLELIGDESILAQIKREIAEETLDTVHKYLVDKYEEMKEAFEEDEFVEEQDNE